MGSMVMHCGMLILVSQLLYASPAWWGYLKADERNRLQSIIVKACGTVISHAPSALSTN